MLSLMRFVAAWGGSHRTEESQKDRANLSGPCTWKCWCSVRAIRLQLLPLNYVYSILVLFRAVGSEWTNFRLLSIGVLKLKQSAKLLKNRRKWDSIVVRDAHLVVWYPDELNTVDDTKPTEFDVLGLREEGILALLVKHERTTKTIWYDSAFQSWHACYRVIAKQRSSKENTKSLVCDRVIYFFFFVDKVESSCIGQM